MSFDKPANVIPLPKSDDTKVGERVSAPGDRRAITKAKTKYTYPWWASENPLEVFWGQLNEEVFIVPMEKILGVAKQAMGRQVLKQEFSDRQALMDELLERTPESTFREIAARIPAQKSKVVDEHAAN